MISTHVLDMANGKPASGVRVVLAAVADGRRTTIATGVTDADGRLREFSPPVKSLDAAVYELTFETGTYWISRGVQPFHPHVSVVFDVTDPERTYHIPLLISPYGYTTYRGS
jgi:5-hydroxyisourate hydrolase